MRIVIEDRKKMYRERDLNPRPTDYDSDALTN